MHSDALSSPLLTLNNGETVVKGEEEIVETIFFEPEEKVVER